MEQLHSFFLLLTYNLLILRVLSYNHILFHFHQIEIYTLHLRIQVIHQFLLQFVLHQQMDSLKNFLRQNLADIIHLLNWKPIIEIHLLHLPDEFHHFQTQLLQTYFLRHLVEKNLHFLKK